MVVDCIFCGEEIEPEETRVDDGGEYRDGWLHQCDSCGAIYSSVGTKIPRIIVYERGRHELYL